MPTLEDELIEMEREEALPLDMLASLFDARGWKYERTSDEEVIAEVKGGWSSYELRAIWQEEDSVLQLIVLPDVKVAAEKRDAIYGALGLINEQLWLGHFDLWSNSGALLFRHGLMLGDNGLLGVEQAQVVVDAALDECERFYPVFQFVLWGGKSPSEAMESALIDTYGEA